MHKAVHVHDYPLFVRTLSEFTADLVSSYDTDVMLENLAQRVTAVLDLSGSGVSLAAADGRLAFATAVPEPLRELERSQEAIQRGPCVAAYTSGEIVAVPDLGVGSGGWQEYEQVAARLGIHAVAGVPMRYKGAPVGALDLYSTEVRPWPDDDLAVAQVMADMATGYLMNAARLREHETLSEQLQRALDSRVLIEQAKGVVAEARSVSVDEAFQRIRAWSRNHNAAIRDVAAQVVHEGLRP